MRGWRRQSGEGLMGCIFWLTIMVVLLAIGFKVVPVKIKSAQLYDYMVEQAKFAGRTSPEELHKRVLWKAQELGLPVTKKDLQVVKRNNRVIMECKYSVVLDFWVYEHVWKFDHVVDRPYFII